MTSKTLERHEKTWQKVFKIIAKLGLKLNKQKCKIWKPQICFFRSVISEQGISPHPGNVKAFKDLPPPQNVPQLQQVLGMINYLDRFLPNLSTLLNPMSELLKSENAGTSFHWQQHPHRSWEEICSNQKRMFGISLGLWKLLIIFVV